MTADETFDEQPPADESLPTDESSPADEQPSTEESPPADQRDDRSHLSDLADGSGCTEIWEYLSEQREDGSDDE